MFALVGGTGLDDLPDDLAIGPMDPRGVRIGTTPGGRRFAFMARHGPGHVILPHQIDHRANVGTLASMGVDRVLAVCAVGSLCYRMAPGHIVVPNSFIDLTRRGQFTRFVEPRDPVVHTDFTAPYCAALRQGILAAGRRMRVRIHGRGTLLCTDGPRFETPAEITAFRLWGADVIGMTGVTEAILANEHRLAYACICVVGNMAAGMGPSIDNEQVRRVVERCSRSVLELVLDVIDEAEEPAAPA